MKDTSHDETGQIQFSNKAQAAPPAEAEVLDFDALVERCMGNLNLANRLLERCQTHLPQEIEEVEKAVQQQDAEQVARLAHRLKGAAATILAEGMKQVAEEIESSSQRGALVDVPPQMKRLRQEWERFKKCADSLLRPANSL